ncbi:MAG: porin family protein [Parabacteroides sp.]|nr:PorT family protein [Bacteroidaceae bacterium]
MKKVLLSMAFVTLGFVFANAQGRYESRHYNQENSSSGNIRYGFVAGMNVSNISSSDMDSKVGLRFGVKSEIGLPGLSEGGYFEVAALIDSKGAENDGATGYSKYTSYYIDIPCHIGYKYVVDENVSLYGNAGPYFALGLFGKSRYYGMKDDSYTSYSSSLFGDNKMNRWDVGLGFQVGAEINEQVQVSMGYDFGLTSLYDDNSHFANSLGGNSKNRNFYLSVGFLF